MAIKAIIFDFDGVVIDSEPVYLAAERRFFSQYGVNVPDDDWKYFKGTSEKDFYELIINRYGIQADPVKLTEYGRRYIKEEFQKGIDYFPGFLDFWQGIAGRYRTALVTSTSLDFLQWIFHKTRIRNRFDLTITADDVSRAKPHPEPYLKAMKQLEVAPAETVIIEDSIYGIEAAIASGAVTIGFLSSLSDFDLPEVDYRASTYIEISDIIKKLG